MRPRQSPSALRSSASVEKAGVPWRRYGTRTTSTALVGSLRRNERGSGRPPRAVFGGSPSSLSPLMMRSRSTSRSWSASARSSDCTLRNTARIFGGVSAERSKSARARRSRRNGFSASAGSSTMAFALPSSR